MAAIDIEQENNRNLKTILNEERNMAFLADFAERVAKLQMIYCIAYLRGIGEDVAADMMSQDNPLIGIQ